MSEAKTHLFKKDAMLPFDLQKLTTDEVLVREIRELLSLEQGDVISTFRPKKTGPSDFAFALLERSCGEKSFIKLASTAYTKAKLRNESVKAGATEVAAALGYPTIGIKTSYAETSSSIGVCEYEYLDFNQGESILNSLEARVQVPPERGPLLAAIIAPRFGIAIPSTIDISGLADLDPGYGTIEKFFDSFSYDCYVVLQSTLPQKAGVDPKLVEGLFREGEEILRPLAEQAESSDTYYFCGNDIVLSNMFFPYRPEDYHGKEVIFYDWEWAGKTHNQVIAFAVDIRTLVRFRPNALLQQALIKALFHYSKDIDRTYNLLRGAVISQTAFEGRINASEQRPHHDHAVELLRALPFTLLLLEAIYRDFRTVL